MARPKTVDEPVKVTLNMPKYIRDLGKQIARDTGTSLSGLVSTLVSDAYSDSRIMNVELTEKESAALHDYCEKNNLTPNELIAKACRGLVVVDPTI